MIDRESWHCLCTRLDMRYQSIDFSFSETSVTWNILRTDQRVFSVNVESS